MNNGFKSIAAHADGGPHSRASENGEEQAGAEMCQAQDQLG
jgi:hypothetical protein